MVLAHPTAVFARLAFHSAESGAYLDMARVLTPVVEVTAPDGTKSLWAAFAVSHREALAQLKKMIPADHTAELSLRRLLRSQKVEGLRRARFVG